MDNFIYYLERQNTLIAYVAIFIIFAIALLTSPVWAVPYLIHKYIKFNKQQKED